MIVNMQNIFKKKNMLKQFKFASINKMEAELYYQNINL